MKTIEFKDKLSQIEIIINLYGKFNIIDGDSGTGKTFLYELINNNKVKNTICINTDTLKAWELAGNVEDSFKNIDVPVVLTSVNTVSSAGRDKYSTVGIDNLQSAYSATEYLIKKGHENIAIMIGEKNDFCVSWWRYKGYIKALMDYNIKINDENLIIGDYDSEKAYEETMKLLKHRKDITAIFVISDFMAIGAAKAVSDSGLRVGEDISIIGFDGMDVSCYYNPGITTINQPKKEMAEKSVEILFELLKKKGENKHILLDTELIERESCMDISKK